MRIDFGSRLGLASCFLNGVKRPLAQSQSPLSAAVILGVMRDP